MRRALFTRTAVELNQCGAKSQHGRAEGRGAADAEPSKTPAPQQQNLYAAASAAAQL